MRRLILLLLPVTLILGIYTLAAKFVAWLLQVPMTFGLDAFTVLSLAITGLLWVFVLGIWQRWFPTSFKELHCKD